METSTIVTSVKLRKFITGTDYDALLTDIALEMIQKALDHCNLSQLPDALKPTIVQMTCDMYQELLERSGKTLGVVSSISDGQQSVSYKTAADVYKVNGPDIDILRGYVATLNKYRVVKFV